MSGSIRHLSGKHAKRENPQALLGGSALGPNELDEEVVGGGAALVMCHLRRKEQHEGETFGPGLVLRGARERLAPILMTALTTGMALLPVVVAGHIPGHELEHPMAVVILGGLVTSTLLNLFVLPSLYLRFRTNPEPEMNEMQLSKA